MSEADDARHAGPKLTAQATTAAREANLSVVAITSERPETAHCLVAFSPFSEKLLGNGTP